MNAWQTIVIKFFSPEEEEYLETLIANELARLGIDTEEFVFNLEVDYLENEEA